MRTSSACIVLSWVLLSATASAQKVVILEFDGDSSHKLRRQVEGAVKKAGDVDIVAIAKYKEAAAKKKLKGGEAMTPAAVARVAKELGIDAAVEGAVGSSFAVRILDGSGQELWSKELAIKKGLLSDDFAKKLAKAIAAAAQTSKKEPAAAVTEAAPKPDAPKAEAVETAPELDLTLRTSDSAMNPRQPIREEPAEPANEPHDSDLDDEVNRPSVHVRPKVIRLVLGGTTTWRSYCARPGVTSCAEFDAMTEHRAGDPVNFVSEAPYLGVQLSGELFPLAIFKNNVPWFLHGVGLVGSVRYGSSPTTVHKETAAGPGPETVTQSVEVGWSAGLVYRYFYAFSVTGEKVPGYIGVRGDYRSYRFTIDAASQLNIPGAFRSFPAAGLDVSFPLVRYLKIEASGSYFFSPKPGPDEIYGYGDVTHPSGGGVGFGYTFEGGLAGDLWGPFGYQARVAVTAYKDRFYGVGHKWVEPCTDKCGGAAEETYVSISWGVTAAF
ncbi:MAG: hypothetical protein K1X64_20495 [Myxococcaceae bacterium]|nr:hypothetical protein [Myxococcaceae bacterium]